MSPLDHIAEQLKALHQERGWSQEDLAREFGVSFSTVNRRENGKAKPSRLAGNQIARILKKMKLIPKAFSLQKMAA